MASFTSSTLHLLNSITAVASLQQFTIGCSPWTIISEPPTFTGYLLHRPQQVISLPHWTALSGLKEMPMSHYSFVAFWNRTPIPLRTRASLHCIKECKVVQRPSAIFRCDGSKSITEETYWDSLISTSNGRGVIMHCNLSTSSFLCPYHNEIHFPVSQCWIFAVSMTCWDGNAFNIYIYVELVARVFFCIQC